MASYVVLEPNSNELHGVDTVFVRDGLRWLAFLFPVFWLLWHRLWIEAALALALALGIGALATLEGFAGGTLLSLLVALFFGLEAPALYLAALRRRGWREVGLVEADSLPMRRRAIWPRPSPSPLRPPAARPADPRSRLPPPFRPAGGDRAPGCCSTRAAVSHARRHHRLRLRQFALRAQGPRAGGARNRCRSGDRAHCGSRGRCRRPTGSFCPASARLPIAAPASERCPAWMPRSTRRW